MTANRVYAQPVHAQVAERSDDELMRELAHGQQEALGPLYSRYAALVFHMAHQSLDRPAAEEIVQEVFLTIWRGAASFDPAQGGFRPWLLRLVHWKILNELRRRRRRPAEEKAEVSDEDRFQQLARALDVPLGTAKTRIRSGLQILRMQLAPIAASLLGLGLALVGFRYVQSQMAYERDERALDQVTTSELVPLRLTPAAP